MSIGSNNTNILIKSYKTLEKHVEDINLHDHILECFQSPLSTDFEKMLCWDTDFFKNK